MRLSPFTSKANTYTLLGVLGGVSIAFLSCVRTAQTLGEHSPFSVEAFLQASDLLSWGMGLAPLWLGLGAWAASAWSGRGAGLRTVFSKRLSQAAALSRERAPQPLPDPAPVDLSVLNCFQTMVVRDDGQFFLDLITDYLEDTQERLAQLSAAHASGDKATLERMAHTIKSSSQLFGAFRLAEWCARIELRGYASDEELRHLETSFRAVSCFLNAYLAELQSAFRCGRMRLQGEET